MTRPALAGRGPRGGHRRFDQEFGFDLTSVFVRFHPEAFLQASLTVDGQPIRMDDCGSMLVTSAAVLVVDHAELIVYTPNVPAERTTWGEIKSLY